MPTRRRYPDRDRPHRLVLTFQLSLFLFSHPHLDGCCSLSVGHVEPLLSDRGYRGGAHFGAKRRPLLGRPRQHKQKLCSLPHSKTGVRRLLFLPWPGVNCPPFSRSKRAKRAGYSRLRHRPRAGALLSLRFLCWLSMYRMKGRIQFVRYVGIKLHSKLFLAVFSVCTYLL